MTVDQHVRLAETGEENWAGLGDDLAAVSRPCLCILCQKRRKEKIKGAFVFFKEIELVSCWSNYQSKLDKLRKEETEGEGWKGIEEFCFEHSKFEMHIRNPLEIFSWRWGKRSRLEIQFGSHYHIDEFEAMGVDEIIPLEGDKGSKE